jgi:hypothetical protein
MTRSISELDRVDLTHCVGLEGSSSLVDVTVGSVGADDVDLCIGRSDAEFEGSEDP